MNAVEERLVQPFYLSMMGLNALDSTGEHWESLVAAGRTATVDDVTRLFAQGDWRAVVMGTWFSLGCDRDDVGATILTALDACAGSLTAPPLAVVASRLVGPDALPQLNAYLERDLAQGYGSASFVAAAVQDLEGYPAVDVQDRDRDRLRGMLDVADRLAAALSSG
ncbi:hypothetical protein IF650_00710 [Cellulosimicrobium terreum]|nr:hypothetical protein [Cellulosimicrobium terreum]